MRLSGNSCGFSMIEVLVVVLVFGLLVGMGVPAYTSISRTYEVKGAAENIAAQVKLMRSKAMATGQSMIIHFAMDSTDAGDYHVHASGGLIKWDLPAGIFYASGTSPGFTITRDGRASASGYIILENQRGLRDTVSVQLSGLVLAP